ncbi:Methylamine utilisation protein MauE [Novosphingobium sp. CF614]|uniref:MauE/DoxX family redox-associated membrane protein n=1 Tax=Novosphingobium sp. CF614 TaxID=1884364 RepID=UPI0008E252B0|nr:MauE/DoxX family redox-associated membrane protein [Novosphingobium sp. CF614]SFF91494.1 Methylamine utilisation protein MauE [Novosphingobium sp. CF614]
MTAPEVALAILTRAAAIGCGLIFLTAGIEKARHRHVLPGVIANYRILPPALVGPASIGLPPLECVVGIMLLSGWTPAPVIAGAALLMVFAAAMAVNLLRGRRAITCGCGRLDLRQHLRWPSVARNALLAALLLASPAFADPLDPIPLDPMSIASAAFGGIAIWIANLLFEAIGTLAATAVSMHRSH